MTDMIYSKEAYIIQLPGEGYVQNSYGICLFGKPQADRLATVDNAYVVRKVLVMFTVIEE